MNKTVKTTDQNCKVCGKEVLSCQIDRSVGIISSGVMAFIGTTLAAPVVVGVAMGVLVLSAAVLAWSVIIP